MLKADGTVIYTGKICRDYENDKLSSMVIGQSVGLIIVVVNAILKIASIKLCEWVGLGTQSGQRALITNTVFLAQFFNTGFLVLIVSANLREHEPKAFTNNFDGEYTDYVPDWYIEVGLTIL